MIPLLRTRLDRWAMPLGLLGLVVAAAINYRLWRRDRAFLDARPEPESTPPPDEWPETPLVSVLVAAWNEAANIERHIGSFLALRYPRKELALCAGGDDGTYEIACRYAGPTVKVLRQLPGEGKQRALARAFAETSGAIIFLTDADCLLADEPFGRTLWPVATGGEQVATGGSRPFDEQLAAPFVFTQAASQLHAMSHEPRYVSGILGRNCAIQRALLVETMALGVPAPTGTDYVLAKALLAAGARIRHVPESLMPTEYPTTARAYLRQQRRWLKNLLVIGYRYKDWFHVRAALVSMALGFVMVGLPLAFPIFGLMGIYLFFILWIYTILARFRYMYFSQTIYSASTLGNRISATIQIAMMDYLAATKASFDILTEKGKQQW